MSSNYIPLMNRVRFIDNAQELYSINILELNPIVNLEDGNEFESFYSFLGTEYNTYQRTDAILCPGTKSDSYIQQFDFCSVAELD